MTMRDKIASIVYGPMLWAREAPKGPKAELWQDDGNSLAQDEARRAADAILAALPDIIPDLVWVERRDDYWDAKGTTYQVAYNGEGKWRVRLGGRVIYKSRPSRCDAKTKANTHHRAAFKAMITGEKT